ncbi:MAG TPA: 6-carboxytetrahydropterin synthase QueD [Myxococcota bacterium]|nr:6-carboxytetrahydropterin synthase QueD [Myxococcota bacterium]
MPIFAEIIKEFRFEAAHFLPRVPKNHQCHRMHGHSYKLTIRAHGPIDEHMGWVMDLKDLSEGFAPLAKVLDHALLNEIEGLENPTGENIALWIFKRLEKTLPWLSSVSLEATDRVAITIHKKDVS